MKYFLLAACSLVVVPAVAQLSFAPATNYPSAGMSPYKAAVGDITGDGKADIIVANHGSNKIAVLAGAGAGSFATAVSVSTLLPGPYSITVGDVNADGHLDVVTCNDDDTAGVLLGTGTTAFSALNTYSTGANGQVQNALLGDVDNDGNPDMIAVNIASNTIAVLLNDKKGHFPSSPILYATGASSSPSDLALGDFDGDGKMDVVVPNLTANAVVVLLNKGNGTFPVAVNYSCGTNAYSPTFVVVGDVNGDGHLDIATANQGNGTVSVLLNTGSGSFAKGVVYSGRLGSSDLISLGMGDVNGDNRPDILVPIQNRNLIKVLLNNGDGTFAPQTTTYATGQAPYSVVVADLNADGRADLVTSNLRDYSVSVLLNTSPTPLAVISTVPIAGVELYPNPAHTSSFLYLPLAANATQATLQLHDALGRLVRTEVAALGKAHELSVSDLAKGVYFVQVQVGERTAVRRLVVD